MRSPELEAKEIKEELSDLLTEVKNKQAESKKEEIEVKRRQALESSSEDKKPEGVESSYSENQQAVDIEAKSGDLQALKKSKGFQVLSGSGKTLAAYQTISRQLSTLVGEYTSLIENDLHMAQKMLTEISRIRAMQKVLLTKLFGKLPEEIQDEEVINELEEFLKE